MKNDKAGADNTGSKKRFDLVVLNLKHLEGNYDRELGRLQQDIAYSTADGRGRQRTGNCRTIYQICFPMAYRTREVDRGNSAEMVENFRRLIGGRA